MEYGSDAPNEVVREQFCEVGSYEDALVVLYRRCRPCAGKAVVMQDRAESLRSFHRRRIDIPVGADALVLDIGSGDKPHWRADVLLDRYLGDEYAGQRSGRSTARVARPLFDADAAAMPFADGVFDYVVCSHMLEHVVDPARRRQSRWSRVAAAGYIEVPEAASAKILDFPSHLWWCRLDGTTLVLTAKQTAAFDPEIQRVHRVGRHRAAPRRPARRRLRPARRGAALGRARRRQGRGQPGGRPRRGGAVGRRPPSRRPGRRGPGADGRDDAAPPWPAAPRPRCASTTSCGPSCAPGPERHVRGAGSGPTRTVVEES